MNSMSFARQVIDYLPFLSTGYNIYECSNNVGTSKKLKDLESRRIINDGYVENFYLQRRFVASIPFFGNAIVLISDISQFAIRKLKEENLFLNKRKHF